MKIVTKPRQGGKTHELLGEMVKDGTAVLVCPTSAAADRAYDLSVKEGLELPRCRFFSAEGFAHTSFGWRQTKHVLVDDLDALLLQYLGAPVKFASSNGPAR